MTSALKLPDTSLSFKELKSISRKALKLESELRLSRQWITELHIDDSIDDVDLALQWSHRAAQVRRTTSGDAIFIDHEIWLLIDPQSLDDEFDEPTEPLEPEDARIGTVRYSQKWVARKGRPSDEGSALALFAVTIARRTVSERSRDLLTLLSIHLGRPPMVFSEFASSSALMDDFLDQAGRIIAEDPE